MLYPISFVLYRKQCMLKDFLFSPVTYKLTFPYSSPLGCITNTTLLRYYISAII